MAKLYSFRSVKYFHIAQSIYKSDDVGMIKRYDLGIIKLYLQRLPHESFQMDVENIFIKSKFLLQNCWCLSWLPSTKGFAVFVVKFSKPIIDTYKQALYSRGCTNESKSETFLNGKNHYVVTYSYSVAMVWTHCNMMVFIQYTVIWAQHYLWVPKLS